MSLSIAKRVFRLVLVVNVVLLGSILLFAWWSLEELEDAMLQSDREAEVQYFQENGVKDRVERIVTAQIISTFIPQGFDIDANLPLVFKGVPVPFQGEVESLGKEYFVVTSAYAEGNYYLAKDLKLFEERETRLTIYIVLLATLLAVTCYCLALIFSKRISQPVRALASRIAAIDITDPRIVLPETNVDSELNDIAHAMNQLFHQLDGAMQRERTLISMASHELRTPVSVVLGAARVIEARQQLQPDDQKTLQRIIVAAEEMSANIRTLLALVRRNPQDLKQEAVDLVALLENLVQDAVMANPAVADRIALHNINAPPVVNTDQALVRMLLNNLIGNALQHTSGPVWVEVEQHQVVVRDGGGSPVPTQMQFPADYKPTSGLGLYIVSLICEQLGWRLEIDGSDQGQAVRIIFQSAG